MVPADSQQIPRARCYSGKNTNHTTTHTFTYRTFHLLRRTIPDASADMCALRVQLTACTICAPQHRTRNPCQVSHAHGLASSAIARHYTRNHNCFLLLRVLRCFTSPRQPPHRLCIHLRVTPHNWCWVSPFGHPRINALLATPRGITQPHTSFIGSACQGIHRTPFKHNTNKQKTHKQTKKKEITQPPTHHTEQTTQLHVQGEMLASTIQFSHTTPTHQPTTQRQPVESVGQRAKQSVLPQTPNSMPTHHLLDVLVCGP